MFEPTPRPDHLDSEEVTVRSAARGARADRDRLALQATREPDNQAVAADLVALEAELDSYRVSLERIAGARRARAAAALADTQEARQVKFDQHRKAAVAAAASRAHAAGKIEKALQDLEVALVADAAAGRSAWEAVFSASRLIPIDARGAVTGLRVAALGDLTPALSRLNRVLRTAEAQGARLGAYVQISGVQDPVGGIADVASKEANQLTETLDRWTLEQPVAAEVEDEFAPSEVA